MASKADWLCVFGMYRSGFSILNGCIDILGARLPGLRNSLSPVAHAAASSRGIQPVFLMHDILLRDLGCGWDLMGGLPRDWRKTDAAKRCRDSIAALLDHEGTVPGTIVLADPRLARFFPLWREVFHEADIEPKCLLLARHPCEVALSLRSHKGLDPFKGHLLWLAYTRDALMNCRGARHCMATFDQLLANPVASLSSIADALDLGLGPDIERCREDLFAFVQPELKKAVLPQELDDISKPYAWIHEQLRRFQVGAEAGVPGMAPDAEGAAPRRTGVDLAVQSFPLIGCPGNPAMDPETLCAAGMLDNILSMLGSLEMRERDMAVQQRRRLIASDVRHVTPYAQVHFPHIRDGETWYPPDASPKILLAPNEWQTVAFPLRETAVLRLAPLRFDPLNGVGIVHLSACTVLDEVTGDILAQKTGADIVDVSKCEGVFVLQESDDSLTLCVVTPNARLFFSPFVDIPERPSRLELWIKVETDLEALVPVWKGKLQNGDELTQKVRELTEAHEDMAGENAALKASSVAASEERTRLLAEMQTEKRLLQEYAETLATAESRIESLRQDQEASRAATQDRQQELGNALAAMEEERNAVQKLAGEYAEALAAAESRIEELHPELARLTREQEAALSQVKTLRRQIDRGAEYRAAAARFIGRVVLGLSDFPTDSAPSPWRLRKMTERLKRLGLLDGEWYRETYPDIAAANIDPVKHYVLHGASEGREPCNFLKEPGLSAKKTT